MEPEQRQVREEEGSDSDCKDTTLKQQQGVGWERKLSLKKLCFKAKPSAGLKGPEGRHLLAASGSKPTLKGGLYKGSLRGSYRVRSSKELKTKIIMHVRGLA